MSKISEKSLNQRGVIHLLVLIAVLGIIVFLAVAALGNFKNGLFADLFNKRFSFASSPVSGPLPTPTPLSSGQVLYWKLDEFSWVNDCNTLTITDYSGLGNSGKSCPAGSGPTTPIVGKVGRAVTLNGTNQYLAATTLGNFGSNMSNGISLAFWVKTTSTAATTVLGSVNPGSGSEMLAASLNTDSLGNAAPGKMRIYLRNPLNAKLAAQTATTLPYNDGNWHQVVWTLNPLTNQIALYFDNVSQPITYAYQQTPGGFTNFSEPFYVGADDGRGVADTFLNGSLDEVYIYNRVLSQNDVTQLYNFAPPSNTPFPTPTPTPTPSPISVGVLPGGGSPNQSVNISAASSNPVATSVTASWDGQANWCTQFTSTPLGQGHYFTLHCITPTASPYSSLGTHTIKVTTNGNEAGTTAFSINFSVPALGLGISPYSVQMTVQKGQTAQVATISSSGAYNFIFQPQSLPLANGMINFIPSSGNLYYQQLIPLMASVSPVTPSGTYSGGYLLINPNSPSSPLFVPVAITVP